MLPARRNQNWLPSIFNDIFDDGFLGVAPAKQFATPAVNIFENEKQFEIEVAAPGMTKDDLKVHLENDDELVIELEHKENGEDKKEKKEQRNWLRREFSYSAYRQAFTIPDEVEVGKIGAEMQNGVLHITLPKKEETVKVPASRQIEIK